MTTRPKLLAAAAIVALVFGGATILSGGRVLIFPEARRAAGAVVPFVLWFNFLAGFAYVAAAIGLWRARPWAAWLALLIAGATLAVLAALGLHIAAGGAYQARTVAAMVLRLLVWAAIAGAAWWKLQGRPSPAR
jgi:hypothetical protein